MDKCETKASIRLSGRDQNIREFPGSTDGPGFRYIKVYRHAVRDKSAANAAISLVRAQKSRLFPHWLPTASGAYVRSARFAIAARADRCPARQRDEKTHAHHLDTPLSRIDHRDTRMDAACSRLRLARHAQRPMSVMAKL